MKTQHTPAPWSHTPMQDTIWANDGQTKVATVADLPWVENPVTGRRSSDFETEQANALLIAAAPDLLEACKLALNAIADEKILQAERGESVIVSLGVAESQIRAAIAKAQP